MSQPILQVEHLKKYFPAGGRKVLRAVDDEIGRASCRERV